MTQSIIFFDTEGSFSVLEILLASRQIVNCNEIYKNWNLGFCDWCLWYYYWFLLFYDYIILTTI